MKKRSLLGLMAFSPLTSLVGCGGSDGNDANIRLVNLATGYSSLDLYYQDSDSNLNQWISGVTYGTSSSYTGVTSGTDTLVFTNSGSTSSLLTQSRSLGAGNDYSIIAYSYAGVLKGTSITETVSTPNSNQAKINVLNVAIDAGTLDVYLLGASDTLATASPVFQTVAANGALNGVVVQTVGSSSTYTLVVTASGSTTDVRLNYPGVVISSQQVVDFVLSSAASGVLVNAMQLVQGGAATPLLNQQARVRVISAVGSEAVDLTLGSTQIAAGDISPNLPLNYALVTAGSSLAVTCDVGGVTQAFSNVTLTAGTDVTLLVWGDTAASASLTVIVDDNRAPSNSSSTMKVRLINGMTGVSTTPLTMSVNGSSVASGIAEGAASAYTTMTVSSGYAAVKVSASGYPNLLLLTQASDEAPTVATHVYTLYMFGTIASPYYLWQQDH